MLIQLKLSFLHLSILKDASEGVSWIEEQRSIRILAVLEIPFIQQFIKRVIRIHSSRYLLPLIRQETNEHANLLGRDRGLLVALNEVVCFFHFFELSTHLALLYVAHSRFQLSSLPSSLFNFAVFGEKHATALTFTIHIFTLVHLQILTTILHFVSLSMRLKLIIHRSSVEFPSHTVH